MFELCEQKCSLPLERERVIRLMMSFNEPMVAAPHHAVQQTHAYICTFKEDEKVSVYIYLYLTTEKVGLMYRYLEEPSSEGSPTAEDDAVQFAEDMGFLMDDLRFDVLLISQQEKLLATIPMFTPIIPNIQEEMPAEIVEVVPEVPIEAAEIVIEETKAVEKQSIVPEEPIKATEAVVEETVIEEQPEEEKVLEQKTEEKVWEPERFLSKFRMRAAAARVKNNKV
ncbi:MAG: social motility and stimulation tgl protein [Deltaproteobacteria bacterium]|nr:social motility and stimulation tgl protein [Deltaproteobacteria bacterium]